MNEQNIRVGNTISQLDTNLGKWITYNKVTEYADGSAINDAKVATSADLYIKVENEYFL
jgi:hypothetical protein